MRVTCAVVRVAPGLALALAAAASQAASFKAVLLVPADDPRLERSRLERGWPGQAGGTAQDGLAMALDDAAFELDAAGAKLELQRVEVADAAAARAASAAADKAGAAALVADLPSAWLLAAADAAPRIPVLNVADSADALRQADCRRNTFHLLPSERMRADATAQFLVARRWSRVLLLTGPLPSDAARAEAAQASIKRFGLKLAAVRPFRLSADPRQRDLANPLLLTGGDHDVVWVVDSDGEFANTLPHRTATPRPVVGDGGLVALAWSARFERYGAPQVSRRLAKAARRAMTAHDWAAWMAGKALAAAALAAPKGPAAAFQKALPGVELDGSKGVAMSFRAWDGQLRQPLLLADGYSVAATAPLEGLLHPRNVLDTLGADEAEKLCKARP